MNPICFNPIKYIFLYLGIVVLLAGAQAPLYAQATDPFLGQLMLVPYNFAPRGWAFCQGQILPIAQNTALFSLLGTTYGGNGQTTFALPDLRGRVPMGAGQGPGLSDYVIGQQGGAESHTLTVNEMPAHSHSVNADTSVGSSDKPGGKLPARNGAGVPQYGTSVNTQMAATMLGNAGGSQPHSIMQPYLVMNWVIALQGIFPQRNSAEDRPNDTTTEGTKK